MNSIQIICIIAGLGGGILVAFINMLITKKGMYSNNAAAFMGINALRFILDLAALGGGFLICRGLDLPLFETLIAIAVGLSAGGMIFLKILTDKMKKEKERSE